MSETNEQVKSLRPCPVPSSWCSKKIKPRAKTSKRSSDGEWRSIVTCPSCGLTTPYFDTEAEAIAAWNTRPEAEHRDGRQKDVFDWCVAAFGKQHSYSVPQRGIRFVEEAIETAQAAGCEAAMLHRLVDHIYSKPAGKLSQEIGGSGITLLALAQAAGLSADLEEARELARVLARPLAHFAARNKAKDDAGFNVVSPVETQCPE